LKAVNMSIFTEILVTGTTSHMRFLGVVAVIGLPIASVDISRAQEPDNPTQAIETIEVVGSHIRGVDPQGLSPVLVLDRPEIERAGVISVAEVLQQLPMNNAGAFNDRKCSF
jgi:hypothetical protein